MVDLTRHNELIIRQEREMIEVFTPFETSNRYSVLTPGGAQILYAYEESGTMQRQFMGTHRPLSIHVVDDNGSPVMEASRDFFWLLSHLRISAGGRSIGALNRQAFIGRKFALVDGNETRVAEISGSIFRPVDIHRQGRAGQRDSPNQQALERSRQGGCSPTPTHSKSPSPTPPPEPGLPPADAGNGVLDRLGLLRAEGVAFRLAGICASIVSHRICYMEQAEFPTHLVPSPSRGRLGRGIW